MPTRRFEKLAVNAGINGPSALARTENGPTLDGPAGEVAREAARETAGVARAVGVDLPDERAVEAVERVADDTAANRSSMREDVENDRRTEVDAIYGAVVDRADRCGVSVPTCRTIGSLIRGWEAARGLR
jgi:2-dehydropantoate 2-reductase